MDKAKEDLQSGDAARKPGSFKPAIATAAAVLLLLTALTIWKGSNYTAMASARKTSAIKTGALVRLGPENILSPSAIPRGKEITFDRDSKIWALCPDGSLQVLIGDNNFYASQSAWASDGKRIAFIGGKRGDESAGLWIANRDGSGLTLLAKPDDPLNVFYQKPAWSPDGQWISFTREVIAHYPAHGHYTAGLTIWVIKPDGTGLRKVTDGNSPTWSPDGQRLAFELRPDLETVNGCEIWTSDLGGTNLKKVTDGTEPAWSPDGQSIAYIKIVSETASLENNSEGIPLCMVRWDGREIWVISLTAGKVTQLTETKINKNMVNNWLQDMRQQGSEANGNLLIGSGMYDDWSPAWLPDDTGLVFTRNYNNEKGAHFVLYRLELIYE